MRILACLSDEELRAALEQAAAELEAEIVDGGPHPPGLTSDALRLKPDIVLVESSDEDEITRMAAEVQAAGAALVVACHTLSSCNAANFARVDDWLLLPTTSEELSVRLRSADHRHDETKHVDEAVPPVRAELVRYQELLYDKLTGLPTLPVMMETAQTLLDEKGELTLLYIHFVWYEKIEEIYGWQKLDDVLESTAAALRTFYAKERPGDPHLMMVSHTGDDDFIVFLQMSALDRQAERRLNELSSRLEKMLSDQIEEEHGEEIAALCGIYVGSATVFRNPKIRTERLIYRALREAAQAARSAEEWERARKVADLRATLSEEAVFIEYHQIIVTDTEEVYGYEALARGVRRELRSPEVLFEVAEEANLIWELSRLLRKTAVSGILNDLSHGQYLFLNIDPHDFDDPTFREMDPSDLGIEDPSRIVLEITERTAIKDYPKFQQYLARFREMGFRFAVDDAGSGYAGLGSIANLAPDYIKLDISLISNIDSNFLKQHLVETMVGFANEHDAKVVAEGVERREEFETVRELGVHLTQGFLFHKPRYSRRPEAIARTAR
ncbi:MAG: EAL domain-containing protein [Longimicrobiales bacterium]